MRCVFCGQCVYEVQNYKGERFLVTTFIGQVRCPRNNNGLKEIK